MEDLRTRDSGFGAVTRPTLESSRKRYGELAIRAFLFACAAVSVAVTTAIVLSLIGPSVSFFREVPIGDFLTGTLWAPSFATPSFGVLPIVVGTGLVLVVALVVAVPVGLLSAMFLSEYASPRFRRVVKPALEVLEGIPTVAIGLFAFWFLHPVAKSLLPWLGDWRSPFSVGVAGVAVGLLTVPLVASVADDAMRSVPRSLREGAYALGSNKLIVSTRIVFPAAISGIVAAVVLAGSRAVGETMVVLIAAGAGNPRLSFDLTEGVQTMTAYIAGRATGDIPVGTLAYDTIFAVGILLFTATLILNLIAMRFVRRFRERYE
jgi:phosphate transport system permease protein